MNNSKKSILHFLNYFDFYGINFPFRYRKKPRFATKLGVLLSFITVIFSLIVSMIYIIQLIDRNYFELYSFQENKNLKIDFSDVPLMIGLLNTFGDSVTIDSNYIEILLDNNNHIVTNDGERTIERVSTLIELESCTNYINSLNSSFKNEIINNIEGLKIDDFLCVKQGQNLSFSGLYGDIINGFNILEIHLNRCNTSKINNNCKTNEEINNYLENLYFCLIYLEKGINHNNYKNPVYNKFKVELIGIFPQIIKRIYYYIRAGYYKSDNGILFSKINNNFFYEYNYKNIDQVGQEDDTFYNNLSILEFAFSSLDYIIIYKRIYRKVTDICAVIGGWIDFLFLLCQFITKYFSHKTLIVDITNHLICKRCKINFEKQYENINSGNRVFHYQKTIDNTNNTSLFNLKLKLAQNDKDNMKVLSSLKNSNLEVKNIHKIPSKKDESLTSESKNNFQKVEKNTINISNIDYGNPILQKYFEESKKQGKCNGQRYKISFLDYILPFSCLKKHSNYNLLILYTEVVDSFLSLEHYLPMVEGFNRMYYREGEEYRAKFRGALFRLQNYDEY